MDDELDANEISLSEDKIGKVEGFYCPFCGYDNKLEKDKRLLGLQEQCQHCEKYVTFVL